MNRRLVTVALNLLPPLSYASLIFYLSSQSFDGIPLKGGSDKVIHLVVFAGLGYLIIRAFYKNGWTSGKYAWAIILVALYGISDEIHQYWVAGRQFSIYDMIADALGGVLAAAFCSLAESRRWPIWL
ncbi:MAG: VanZ family protein [bacterium]|nr:VanZ family protein [bacterium]